MEGRAHWWTVWLREPAHFGRGSSASPTPVTLLLPEVEVDAGLADTGEAFPKALSSTSLLLSQKRECPDLGRKSVCRLEHSC